MLLDLQGTQAFEGTGVENASQEAAGLGADMAGAAEGAADDAAVKTFSGVFFKGQATHQQRVQNHAARHTHAQTQRQQ